MCKCVWVCEGVCRRGLGFPWPPVRNDIVTPCHLFYIQVQLYKGLTVFQRIEQQAYSQIEGEPETERQLSIDV